MTLIIDANIALKQVLTGDGTDSTLALITANPLTAPHLIWIECANVLWVKARAGRSRRTTRKRPGPRSLRPRSGRWMRRVWSVMPL